MRILFSLWRPALCVLCALCAAPAVSGEYDSQQAQPYEKIRYPTFREGRLQSLLIADQAEAYDLTAGTPRINMRNVVITLYDDSAESLKNTPENEPLPVKMVITSDRGYFSRRPPEPGAALEEIANLEGNVVLRQMIPDPGSPRGASPRPRRLPAGVLTEIRCEHAQWNNSLRKLNGDGEVEFIQEDSRIVGTGFLYLADDDAMNSGGGTSGIKEWGGIVFIEHNARMEIDRDGGAVGFGTGPGAAGRTVITCRDTASYKLREREIQFERDVRIRREGLLIESDILKVFLRREDDPLLAADPADPDNPPAPGQVKSIVATTSTRPGSVIITGFRMNTAMGVEDVQYTAKGGRADFDYDSNRITLTDTRDQRRPEVEFGADRDRVTDGNLVFIFTQVVPGAPGALRPEGGAGAETVLDSLNTYGGRGEVLLRSRKADEGESSAPTIPTLVKYQGEMNYNRVEGRIRFQNTVSLRRADLNIDSELLDVRLSSDGKSVEPNQVNRILAETNVVIQSGEYHATSHRAEYDVYTGAVGPIGTGLDTLRLFAPTGGTPTNPIIRDTAGNQISAPEIHMQRLTTEAGHRDQHLMVARGISVCDFITGVTAVNGRTRPRVVSVRCERGMEYNQNSKKARFEGAVTATSDNPADNYVLTSDRLLIDFEESPDPANPGEYVAWFRRITAEGTARLLQDSRVCEAANIIRDFPSQDSDQGDIYLQGAPAREDMPPQMAVLREEDNLQNVGAMFIAPLIKSTAKGELIQANGPGQLSMPDENADGTASMDFRSEIHFTGAASYEMIADGTASDANFWGGVTLRQPSRNIEVVSDDMSAHFIQENPQGAAAAPADEFTGQPAANVEFEQVGRLRRAEARNNVRIEHALPRGGRRVAVGDAGVIEFTGTGNIIRLTADRSVDSRRFVMARDLDGMTLRAPEMEVREAQGITRASGPGDLQIPANAGAEGMSAVPTRILYGENGTMVYNELALNIRVSDSVRVVQPGAGGSWSYPSLDGICDQMEVALLEPPAAGMGNEDTMSRIERMDALGHVLLRVYADPPPENPNMDWLSRPGTTFFTRGDQALYDVAAGQISIFCVEPSRQPQLLLNMVEQGGSPRRQRLKADRFVLQTSARPRRWNFEGQLDSRTIQQGEAFDFVD